MGRLVYSTDTGRLCPDCGEAKHTGRCKATSAAQSHAKGDGIVRIRRETKGRKGKGVSIVDGLAVEPAELKRIAKLLKQKCSSGGNIKDGCIEIQGDHRETIKALLSDMGHTVKLAGG